MKELKIAYIILYFISVAWIVVGVCLIIYTDLTREALKKVFYPEKFRLWSLFGVVAGLLLIVGGLYARKVLWLSFILGLLGIAKGVYLFKASPEHIRRVLDRWYEGLSDETVRFWGLITLFLGILILSYLL